MTSAGTGRHLPSGSHAESESRQTETTHWTNMASPPTLSKTSPILIVGAGVFGLSTALHLAERGYTAVTVLDAQAHDGSQYDPQRGSAGASADASKIVRVGYGPQSIYQALALEALAGWRAWNAEAGAADRLFVDCGELAFSDDAALSAFEAASVRGVEAAGYPGALLVVGDAADEAAAARKGVGGKMDPFRRRQQGKDVSGVLDTLGGLARADKACRFVLGRARAAGVRFVFGDREGAVQALVRDGTGRVLGVRTRDGTTHAATVTVLAAGAWTPTLLPALDGLCEATAGSVATLRIPAGSPLWARLAPEAFPAWAWNMRHGAAGGLYGLPRDGEGVLKIGYRGTKYTNPVRQADGRERSVPLEAGEEGPKRDRIPKQALEVIRAFLDEYLPELREEGILVESTRFCWYTDSFDNHLVVDWVPGHDGLMVATGGSGHAFKYLPVIGSRVVDVMEGVGLDRPELRAWRWRKPKDGETPVNVLMEGSSGPRALGNVEV